MPSLLTYIASAATPEFMLYGGGQLGNHLLVQLGKSGKEGDMNEHSSLPH